eukprot:13039931-Alexandrium_andersonii.AAC.1
MSASLVGSEMCIRDRRRHPCAVPTHMQTPVHAHADTSARAHADTDTHAAVSYTHLTLPTIA